MVLYTCNTRSNETRAMACHIKNLGDDENVPKIDFGRVLFCTQESMQNLISINEN